MNKTLLLASILPFLVACNSSDTSGNVDVDSGLKPVNPIEPGKPVQPIEPESPVHPIEPGEPVQPIEPDTPVNPIEPGEPVNPIEPVVPMYQAVADHFQKTYDQIHDLCESDETFSVYYQEKTDTSSQVADITLIFNNELLNNNHVGIDLKHRTAITQRVIDVEDFSLVTYYRNNIYWEKHKAHSFDHIHAQTRHQAVVMNSAEDKDMPLDFLRMSEQLTYGVESTFSEIKEGQLTAHFKYYQPSVFYKLNSIFNN